MGCAGSFSHVLGAGYEGKREEIGVSIWVVKKKGINLDVEQMM